MLTRLTILLALLTAVLAGCGEDDDSAASGGGLEVVATTTHVADLARNVGGDHVAVTGLLAANADPHEHEVRPRDVEAVAKAGVVLRSGGDLDEWLGDAVEGSGTEAPVVTMIEHVETIEGGHGHEEEEEHADEEEEEHADEEEEEHAGEGEEETDPHWWQDPRNAERAVAAIRDALAKADPDNADAYRANADRYLQDLRALDTAVEKCIDVVPAKQRKLVTTHDSMGYYADRYDIEVIGAVIPSLTTQGQASAGETAELVRTIRSEGAKAIFTESGINQKVEDAIAREAGARVGQPLWADTLGPDGSGAETYLESVASNTRALVDGFTGGAQSCSLPG